MSQRFQFSLKRLFGSMALLCLALLSWRLAFQNDDMNLLAVIAFIVFLLTAVGVLIGRPITFALSALLGLAFFLIVALAELILQHRQ